MIGSVAYFVAEAPRAVRPEPKPPEPETGATERAAVLLAPEVKAEVEALVAEGGAVMSRISSAYPNTEPFLADASQFLVVALPAQAWSGLSLRERVALSYFVESRVAHARANPARFAITPTDAPNVSAVRKGVAESMRHVLAYRDGCVHS